MKQIKWWQWLFIVFIGIPAVIIMIAMVFSEDTALSDKDRVMAAANAEFTAISDDRIFAMTVDPSVDPDILPDIARKHCGDRGYCNVMGWIDPEFAAKGFPMLKRETDEVKFQYLVNRSTGLEQMMWDCRIWEQTDAKLCLPVD